MVYPAVQSAQSAVLKPLSNEAAKASAENLFAGAAHGSTTLLALAFVMVFIAGAALVSTYTSRRETQHVARLARQRAGRMHDLLSTVRMAETIAGVGVWQYDPRSGAQQWSAGMRQLFGVQSDEEMGEGDAETLLYANDVDLIGNVVKRLNQTEPYALSFEIYSLEGENQTISVEACNLRDADGEVIRVVAVLRDVTDQKERERRMEHSRAAALREARRARDLAETDALTGLANRRRVMSELDRMIVETRSKGASLILVIFDIDHFKVVNDTYGHPQGDKVLKRVARIAAQQAREGDCVGRVGGEEFVWIVPGATKDIAKTMTERLRLAIAVGSAAGEVPAITISVGFADLLPADTSLTLFARVDEALYDAKNSGRNKVCMAA